jgi:hypothetical protein
MSTLVAPRPSRQSRKPVTRTIRVLAPGQILIRVGKVEREYTVAEFPCGIEGRGFRCERFGAQAYDVLLAKNGQDDRCDCLGFEAHGNCKHRDGLKTLLERGLLDETPALHA